MYTGSRLLDSFIPAVWPSVASVRSPSSFPGLISLDPLALSCSYCKALCLVDCEKKMGIGTGPHTLSDGRRHCQRCSSVCAVLNRSQDGGERCPSHAPPIPLSASVSIPLTHCPLRGRENVFSIVGSEVQAAARLLSQKPTRGRCIPFPVNRHHRRALCCSAFLLEVSER